MPLHADFTISQQSVLLSAQRPVRVQWVTVASEVGPHDHAYHEICVILKGKTLHQSEAGKKQISTGRAIVVPPTAVHGFKTLGTVKAVNVYYLAEWLAIDLALLWAEPGLVPLFLSRTVIGPKASAEVSEFDLTGDEIKLIAADLRDIESESEDALGSNALIRGAFLKVLVRLSRAYVRAFPEPGNLRPELWRVITHVEHLVQSGEPMNLLKLAKEVNLSADYLGKLFYSAMGRTIGEYYQLRRVHRACQLLMDPRYSTTDVALELGYSDAPHLCRMFKKHRKMSPMEYRVTYSTNQAFIDLR